MVTADLMMIVQLMAMPLVHTPYQLELWESMVTPVPLMKCALQNWSLLMSQIHLETLLWYVNFSSPLHYSYSCLPSSI